MADRRPATPKPTGPKPPHPPARTTAHAARTYARGLQAEDKAAERLVALGFEILARRVRTKAGEVDLIARLGDLLVFCEVKVRADLATAGESLLPRQRRRIAAAAEAYLADHPELAALNMRFDAVLMTNAGQMEHVPGAFDASF